MPAKLSSLYLERYNNTDWTHSNSASQCANGYGSQYIENIDHRLIGLTSIAPSASAVQKEPTHVS
eukprot:12040402-Ditylum_brightwellii.AAC.1